MSDSAQAAATLCPERQQIKGTVWPCWPAMISSRVGEPQRDCSQGKGTARLQLAGLRSTGTLPGVG
jgi:hypothetical protein